MSDTRTDTLRPTVLSAMRRHRWLVISVLAICACLGGLAGAALHSDASATASIVVADPTTSSLSAVLGGGAQPDPNYVQDQVAILKLPSTSALAAHTWNTKHPHAKRSALDVSDNLTVSNSDNTDLIKITYKDPSPVVAAGMANTVVAAYEQTLTTRSGEESSRQLTAIKNALATLARNGNARDQATQDQRTALLAAQAQVLLRSADTSSGIKAISPAAVPAAPTQSGWLRFGLLGLLIGLIPAAGLAYVVASRRRRFVNRFEPEVLLQSPLITDVPAFEAERLKTVLPAVESPGSSAAEAFRFAWSSLTLRESTRHMRTFGVVSPSSGDGKTTVAANLALTAALDGLRVLAIDGDLQGRALTSRLLRSNVPGPGLLQLLDGTVKLDKAVHRVSVGTGCSLDVLPGGPAGRNTDALSNPAVAALFAELRVRYDLVIVDCAPVLQVAYTSTFLKQLDQVLAVVAHRSSVGSVEELDERLRYLNVDVAGYVYTKAPLRPELGKHSQFLQIDESVDLKARHKQPRKTDDLSNAPARR